MFTSQKKTTFFAMISCLVRGFVAGGQNKTLELVHAKDFLETTTKSKWNRSPEVGVWMGYAGSSCRMFTAASWYHSSPRQIWFPLQQQLYISRKNWSHQFQEFHFSTKLNPASFHPLPSIMKRAIAVGMETMPVSPGEAWMAVSYLNCLRLRLPDILTGEMQDLFDSWLFQPF